MRGTDSRRRELAAIHAAARDLGIDDEEYRVLLEQVTGARSAKDLSAAGRRRMLDHLRKAGWRPPVRRGTPRNLGREPMLQKIEALLADMKLSWSYADAIAKRQTGVERVAWLRKPAHLRAVIAALHVEQEKRVLLAQIDERLEALGLTRTDLVEEQRLRPHWERNRPTLRAMLERLSDASLTTGGEE